MEDQPTDSGDLTAEPSSPVPEGKSARRRHRLPRRDLKQQDDDTTAEVEPSAAEVEPQAVDPEPEAEPVTPEAEVVEEVEEVGEVEEPVATPEPVRRSRFGFRRKKTPQPAPDPVEPEAESEPEPAGDDADTANEDETVAVAIESDEPPPVVASTIEGEDSEDGDDAEPANEEPEPVLVPHRTASRPFKIAAAVAGVLVIAASAFAGAKLQPYLSDRASVQIKVDVARTATDAITTLWTYTPDDIDKLGERASKYLGGDLANEYRKFIDSIVEANKQAQITNQTQVVGAAVESLTPTEATALVFTNTTATSPVSKNIPSLRYVSYRLTLEKRGQHWLVTRMPNITSLDLTPRL